MNKEHLTPEGLNRIIALKANLNLGLSEELIAAFEGVVPVERPVILDQKIRDPHWVAGFTTGEGCFFIRLSNNPAKPRVQVQLAPPVGQHVRDKVLMNSLVSYFGCGRYIALNNKSFGEFVVTKFDNFINIIIPFEPPVPFLIAVCPRRLKRFDKYKIEGCKFKDFQDWCRAAELMKNKAHLTPSGLEEIRKLKYGMNGGR